MLTTVVVSNDMGSSNLLRAVLQQTGLVSSVRDWTPSVKDNQISAEAIPDVVVLDLNSETEPYFTLAARVRRMRPAVHIIACAPTVQPDPELLLQAMRSGVQEFFPKPVDPAALRDTLARFHQEKESAGGGKTPTRLFIVAGSKGGVGTTTVAVNLSVQMAQVSNKRVVLLDFARPLGQVSLLLDLQSRFTLRDAIENLDRLDAHFFGGLLMAHKSGLQALAGIQHTEDWTKITSASLGRVVNVAQSAADLVVVDAGVANIAEWSQLYRVAQMILLVAEANVPALWSLERHLGAAVVSGLDRDRVRVIINRWRRVDEEALKNVEKNLRHPIYTRLPNDFRQASEAVNMGTPLPADQAGTLGGKIRQLAGQLSGIGPPVLEKRSGLSNLFSR